MNKHLNIIGSGPVAQTLGYLFARENLLSIGAVYSRSELSARKAIDFMGQGQYCASIQAMPHADITLIATPDDVIENVARELSLNAAIRAGDVVFHCSGALTSDSLSALSEKGCLLASVHPMCSFKQAFLSIQAYPGTYCALEGQDQALHILYTLFLGIGSINHIIKKDKKALYHAAGVFASNYLITLSQQSLCCLKAAGVTQDIAMGLITNLMQHTVSNLKQMPSPRQALTGPIQRGDTATIDKHLAALDNMPQKELYMTLMRATRLLLCQYENEDQA